MSDTDRVSAYEILKGFGQNDNLVIPLIDAWPRVPETIGDMEVRP